MGNECVNFLIVEDDGFQLRMLVKILGNLGAKYVYTARDGAAAVDLMRELAPPPDIILLDLQMPRMDGLEFMRHLGAAPYRPAVVITSALDRNLLSTVETMAEVYGIDLLGTAEKPLTPGKLEEVLERYHGDKAQPAAPGSSAPSFSADEIAQGLENDEFEPFFQPKVCIATSELTGAEALARWRHPRYGVLSPAAFIATLEDAGDIDLLLRGMLIKAVDFCGILQAWGQACTIAVNVSMRSLTNMDSADQITEIVRSGNLSPERIVLELSGAAVTTDLGKVLENLVRLRMRGFGLSLADPGAGNPMLQQLTRVPLTEFKIDQSVFSQAVSLQAAKVVLASSIGMARSLGIQAVAVGVETSANWNLLTELGCDMAQGYYIAKPMTGALFLEWASAWPRMRGR